MNVLLIMSDEHSHQVMGCSGHPVVKTPVLDRLAKEGTMFASCYTNSPLCTPARAGFFAGLYVNRLGTWDNATPYDGRAGGISEHLLRYGYPFTTFGKLDLHPDGEYPGLVATMPNHRTKPQAEGFFRGEDYDIGAEQRFRGIGIRSERTFDDKVRDLTLDWLRNKRQKEQPWVLYVGFHDPHFPFFVDQERWDYYNARVTAVPAVARGDFDELNGPLRSMRRHFRGETVDEETVRKAHVGYYAMTSRMDENVGAILQTLKDEGMEEDTLIIYTSDHGEQLGHHGLWWKCCMYEESAHVPLIMKGPGIPAGSKVEDPVTLIDLYPTICDALQIPLPQRIDGRSLLPLARGDKDPSRPDFAFSEYHAHGMPVGMYMIRWQQWKYVYYVDHLPQLFDLDADPQEMCDLAGSADSSEPIREALRECEKRLRSVCDPEEVDARARHFQSKMRGMLKKNDSGKDTLDFVPHPEYSL